MNFVYQQLIIPPFVCFYIAIKLFDFIRSIQMHTLNKNVCNVNEQGLLGMSIQPIAFLDFNHNFRFFLHTNHVRVVFFSTAPTIFSIKNWLPFSSVLITSISSFTFDKYLILIFSVFKDSIQLLNLQSRYSEFLFVSKSYFFTFFQGKCRQKLFHIPLKTIVV